MNLCRNEVIPENNVTLNFGVFESINRCCVYLIGSKNYDVVDDNWACDVDYGEGHIYNLSTQKTWRTKAEVPYIRESLDKMLKLAQSTGVKSIALPTVSAGLGGLFWDLVKALIEDVASNYSMVDLFVVESYSTDFKQQ